jgi:hypothetical protein
MWVGWTEAGEEFFDQLDVSAPAIRAFIEGPKIHAKSVQRNFPARAESLFRMRDRSLFVSATLTAVVACGNTEPGHRVFSIAAPALDRGSFYARNPVLGQELDLRLDKLETAVTIGSATLRTHLAITFTNPTAQQVEAIMRIPIPPGAAVNGAILQVGERSMEGVFVARERARQIYNSFLQVRRDPLLITWHDGEWIDVNIFPVNAAETRSFEIEWIEPTATTGDGERAFYRLPILAHRGRIVARPTRLIVDGKELAVPEAAVIDFPLATPPAALAIARAPGDPFDLVLSSQATAVAEAAPKLIIVAETSGAMDAKSRRQQRALLESLLASLPKSSRFTLLTADWTSSILGEGLSIGAAKRALARLDAVPSAGALDLSYALSIAVEKGKLLGAEQIVYLGKGADTFHARDAFADPLEKLREAEISLYAIAVEQDLPAPISDAAWVSGGRAANATELSSIVAELCAKAANQKPALAGIDRWYPLRKITGEFVWVGKYLGEMPAGAELGELRELEVLFARAASRPRAHEADPGEKHRVLTPLTSILALETDADYARFGLQRETPGRIGAVLPEQRTIAGGVFGPGGLGTGINNALGGLRGTEMGDAGGAGGLGTRGSGPGSGGLGIGIGTLGTLGYGGGLGQIELGGRGKGLTRVVPAKIEVNGSLSREMVNRVVRRHLARLKYCYEKALAGNPSLAGKISLQFAIAAGGKVSEARIRASTMRDDQVESCLVHVVRTLVFPKLSDGGESVIVTYPLVFTRGDHDDYSQPPRPDPWTQAWELLERSPARGDRVAKIAKLLGAPQNLQREALAWWLAENRLRPERGAYAAARVIARLLYDSEQPLHAERVLSEAAMPGYNMSLLARDFRDRGAIESADRMSALGR